MGRRVVTRVLRGGLRSTVCSIEFTCHLVRLCMSVNDGVYLCFILLWISIRHQIWYVARIQTGVSRRLEMDFIQSSIGALTDAPTNGGRTDGGRSDGDDGDARWTRVFVDDDVDVVVTSKAVLEPRAVEARAERYAKRRRRTVVGFGFGFGFGFFSVRSSTAVM